MKLTEEQISAINQELSCLSLSDKEYFILEHGIDQLRVCDYCGKLLDEGYVINNGNQHYCNDCFDKLKEQGKIAAYILQDIENACTNDNSESYWTVWNE